MIHLLSCAAAFVVGAAFIAGFVGACLVAIAEFRMYGKAVMILSALVSAGCVMAVRHA